LGQPAGLALSLLTEAELMAMPGAGPVYAHGFVCDGCHPEGANME
jgi:hypothetical protein